MKFASDTMQRRVPSPLGEIAIAATPRGISGLWFVGQRHQPAEHLTGPNAWPHHSAAHPHLDRLQSMLEAYFDGSRTVFDITIDWPHGTPFQRDVWLAMQALAHGRTCSYADLARSVGRPLAVRAVGAAVGRNPLSVIVPCHRVLATSGALTGYAGGLPRKAHLLALEARALQLERL